MKKNPAAVALGSLGGKALLDAKVKWRFVCSVCESRLRWGKRCPAHPSAPATPVLRTPSEQAAARLGSAGGDATAAKGTTAKQSEARRANAKKATAARKLKAKERKENQ